jgi:hypothetical protein
MSGQPPAAPGLSIIALGRTTPAHVGHLVALFPKVQQLEPRGAGGKSELADVTRAVDAAANDWILVLEDDEVVDAALAQEISEAASPSPRAWAFRIRREVMYAGGALRLNGGAPEAEVRLFHRRHGRVTSIGTPVSVKVQGTVVRLRHPLFRATFGSAEEHETFLRARGTRRSPVGRILIFGWNAIGGRLILRGKRALRYAWIEAGYRVRD